MHITKAVDHEALAQGSFPQFAIRDARTGQHPNTSLHKYVSIVPAPAPFGVILGLQADLHLTVCPQGSYIPNPPSFFPIFFPHDLHGTGLNVSTGFDSWYLLRRCGLIVVDDEEPPSRQTEAFDSSPESWRVVHILVWLVFAGGTVLSLPLIFAAEFVQTPLVLEPSFSRALPWHQILSRTSPSPMTVSPVTKIW